MRLCKCAPEVPGSWHNSKHCAVPIALIKGSPGEKVLTCSLISNSKIVEAVLVPTDIAMLIRLAWHLPSTQAFNHDQHLMSQPAAVASAAAVAFV